MKSSGGEALPQSSGLFHGKPVLYFAHTRNDNAGRRAPPEARRKKTHKLSGWETVCGKVFLGTCGEGNIFQGGSQEFPARDRVILFSARCFLLPCGHGGFTPPGPQGLKYLIMTSSPKSITGALNHHAPARGIKPGRKRGRIPTTR